jgi:hypothetical protein
VQVDATLELEEVPESDMALNVLVADITQELDSLVTNITRWNFAEFTNLYGAKRTDVLLTLPPTSAPTPLSMAPTRKPTIFIAESNREVNNADSNDKELNALVPAGIVAAGVFLLTALLIGFRSSRQSLEDVDGSYSQASPAKKKLDSEHTDESLGVERPPTPEQTIHMEDGQTMIHLPSAYMNTNSSSNNNNNNNNSNTATGRPPAMMFSLASESDEYGSYDQDDNLSHFHGGNFTTNSSPLRDDQQEIPYPQKTGDAAFQ